VDRFPQSDAAPEALYWARVSHYKGKGDASALGATAREFTRRYQDSSWAKKASVWGLSWRLLNEPSAGPLALEVEVHLLPISHHARQLPMLGAQSVQLGFRRERFNVQIAG